MSILKRIETLRETKGGLSINRLEKEAGLTRGSVSKWDSHPPSYEKAKKVADYFGVSAEFILTGEEQQEKPTPLKSGELEESRKKMIDFALTADIKKVELMASVLETVGK